MTVYARSRYENASVVPVADHTGTYRATVLPDREIVPVASYTTHRVVQGDSLMSLAATAYDDPELWWLIADANVDLVYPDELTPGALLTIPIGRNDL